MKKPSHAEARFVRAASAFGGESGNEAVREGLLRKAPACARKSSEEMKRRPAAVASIPALPEEPAAAYRPGVHQGRKRREPQSFARR